MAEPATHLGKEPGTELDPQETIESVKTPEAELPKDLRLPKLAEPVEEPAQTQDLEQGPELSAEQLMGDVCLLVSDNLKLVNEELKLNQGNFKYYVNQDGKPKQEQDFQAWGGAGTVIFRLTEQGLTADLTRSRLEECDAKGKCPPVKLFDPILPDGSLVASLTKEQAGNGVVNFLPGAVALCLTQLAEHCQGKSPEEYPAPVLYFGDAKINPRTNLPEGEHMCIAFACHDFGSKSFDGLAVVPLDNLNNSMRYAYLSFMDEASGEHDDRRRLKTGKWENNGVNDVFLSPVNGKLIHDLGYGYQVYDLTELVPKARQIRFLQQAKLKKDKQAHADYLTEKAEYENSKWRYVPFNAKFDPAPWRVQKPNETIVWASLKNVDYNRKGVPDLASEVLSSDQWYFDPKKKCLMYDPNLKPDEEEEEYEYLDTDDYINYQMKEEAQERARREAEENDPWWEDDGTVCEG